MDAKQSHCFSRLSLSALIVVNVDDVEGTDFAEPNPPPPLFFLVACFFFSHAAKYEWYEERSLALRLNLLRTTDDQGDCERAKKTVTHAHQQRVIRFDKMKSHQRGRMLKLQWLRWRTR